MGVLKEFKEFAVKGNVLDLAVGLIIGAEFGKIVNSLVGDVIMPIVGIFLGGIDFSSLVINLNAFREGAPPVNLKIGTFITTVISFTIIAFAVFLIVKAFNKMRSTNVATEEKK